MYSLKFNTIITIKYSIMNPCAYYTFGNGLGYLSWNMDCDYLLTNCDLYNVDLFWKYIAGTQYRRMWYCMQIYDQLLWHFLITVRSHYMQTNIQRIMYGLLWIMISWSKVSSAPMSLSRDCISPGIHRQLSSWVTRKSICMVSPASFHCHFTCFLMLWRH